VCDRIAILYEGELKELGRVDDLLKEQGQTQLLTTRLNDEAIKDVEEVLGRHGAKLISVDHPTNSLEDLFLKTVHESRERPGRRYVPREEAEGDGSSASEPKQTEPAVDP
ncbi:MAG: ABC transporter ATP-binding protein, partial [Planctomycetes bacterium]|nr:ABC transporter ATP-binding protein [Planctomycetota bacterium]